MKNKQVKEAYKLQKFRMGVFHIRNTINGKILVGSSINLDAIWNRIKMELKFGGHRNEKLQREWKDMGEENFKFEILSEIEEKDGENVNYNKEVKKLEEMFMEELQPFAEKGYHASKA